MKRLILVILIAGAASMLSAQQDPQFTVSQFFTPLYQNPAVAGSHDAFCFSLVGRTQWVGFGGGPQTYLFSFDAPFKFGGAGLTVVADKLGQENTFIAKGTYAYRHSLGPGTISAGLSVGYISKSIGNDWQAVDGVPIDPNIPANGASAGGFDFDLGLFYQINKKLYVGLSATHLTASQLKKDLGYNTVPTNQPALFNYQIDRTLYLTAQYQFQIFNPDWVLKPTFVGKTDFASSTFDIAAIVEYQERFWFGVDYRLIDAVALLLGADFKIGPGNLKVGYSYDFTTSQIRKYSSGSHELFVRYCFNIEPKIKVQKHRTVRFL